ncbi:MAG: SigE family RNA polymerase sigma factor [Actinomycetota bacterium]
MSDEKKPVRITYADFDAFYASCWDEMYRSLAVTLRDHELAKESVDEAMTRAYQRWSSVRTYSNQCGWIYRVGMNWAISQKRKTKREVRTPMILDGAADEHLPDPDLHEALARLGMEQRAVVVLRYLLDWSEEDVANTLEIPRGTVKSRLNRAMAKLRKELS